MLKKNISILLLSSFLIANLFFSFANFVKAAAVACDPCCENDCSTGVNLECAGYNKDTCNMVTKTGTGQCQPKGSVTLCPFSSHTEITELVDEIAKWIFYLALVIAPLMVLLGGFYMLTSSGDPVRSKKGKQIIIWAMVGLGVILFAKAFIAIIRFVLK